MTTRLHRWLFLSAGLAALGCAPGFESPARLRSLRVLAVQKDKPYARPGDTVRLSMLLDDAGHDGPRGVKVTWFGGCENPLGDLYAGCFATLTGSGPAPTVGEGLEFSLPISSDIISRRPRPTASGQPPYGISFVFFAACAGTITIVPPPDPDRIETLPIQCLSAAGQPLGAEDFVLGYTQVQVYDTFTNANPIVTGLEIDGRPVTPECIGAACLALQAEELGIPWGDAGAPDAGATDGGTAGAPDPCDTDPARCFPLCTKEDQDECPKHDIRVVVDPSSAEHDTVQEARTQGSLLEQMWVNYYVDAGKLQSDVKLLNDATTGWNSDPSSKLLTPKEQGPFRVWAVAHDNRGGAEWVRARLSTRP